MPSRTLHKPVPDGTYIVEWAKFIGPREHPELKEWVMDVGRIEGDWFRSFDGKIRKKVSSEYFLVKRRIRRTALNMPGECTCNNRRRSHWNARERTYITAAIYTYRAIDQWARFIIFLVGPAA